MSEENGAATQELIIIKGATGLPAIAKATIVTTQTQYEGAITLYKQANDGIKQIEAKRVELKEGILKAGRAIDASAKESKAPFVEAKDILYPRIDAWEVELARKQKQLEDEAIAKAKKETDQLALENAAAAEEAGELEAIVNAILDEPVYVPPAPVVQENKRVPGVTRKAQLQVSVVDVLKLAQWVIVNPQYVHYLIGNVVAMNADLKQMKERFKVDGTEVV